MCKVLTRATADLFDEVIFDLVGNVRSLEFQDVFVLLNLLVVKSQLIRDIDFHLLSPCSFVKELLVRWLLLKVVDKSLLLHRGANDSIFDVVTHIL